MQASITDGLHYDRSLKPYEVSADGKSSGTPDDMWAFTTRNAWLDFRAATMFAAASRALEGYNDDLSKRALAQSKRLMQEANALMAQDNNNNSRRMGNNMATNLQLYAATHEQSYLDNFKQQIWAAMDDNAVNNMQTALDAIPYMDEAYKQRLRPYIQKYQEYITSFDKDNPYGVPIGLGNWAGSGNVVSFGTTICFCLSLLSRHYQEG